MTGTQVLTVVGILVSVLLGFAAVVGTWAALKVGRNTQTVTNYRNAAQSSAALAEAQEGEIAQLKEERDKQAKEIADLKGQVAVLRDLVTGASTSNENHRAVMEKLEAIDRRIGAGNV